MTVTHQVLGTPGRDNALLVRVESGQRTTRLLFDCGEGCLSALSLSEIQSIDHLLFSHLHMDHIGGFDSFFRCTFSRTRKDNRIWGPVGTSTILHHRFQGFLWNLIDGNSASWHVHDVSPERIECFRYELSEAFAVQHDAPVMVADGVVLETTDFTVRAIPLQHHGLCLGYVVREKPKLNVDQSRLASLGLTPGPWLARLKDQTLSEGMTVGGQLMPQDQLRDLLLVETQGQSIAYLTDFLLDSDEMERLTAELSECDTVICEAQYHPNDLELAQRNHHTTVTQVAALAAAADCGELILFHLSDRYSEAEWSDMLDAGRSVFTNTHFSSCWDLSSERTSP